MKWWREIENTRIQRGKEEEMIRREGRWLQQRMSGKDTEQINHCRQELSGLERSQEQKNKGSIAICIEKKGKLLEGTRCPMWVKGFWLKGVLSLSSAGIVQMDLDALTTSWFPVHRIWHAEDRMRNRALAMALAAQLVTLCSQERLGSGKRLFNYRTDSPINQEWPWEEESTPVSYWSGYR